MKKPENIIGFAGIYLLVIFLGFLLNQLLFSDVFGSFWQALIHAAARVSLVTVHHESSVLPTTSYLFYSIISTQLAGTMWLTMLLWCYWQVFEAEEHHRLKDALILTLKVSMIFEGALFLFFLYAIPADALANTFSEKIIAALTLTVGSFHNAGLTHINQILGADIMQEGFVMQLGIIAGSIIGSLGIFVVDELFAPVNLRHRLAHPETDWSFITKISTFGGFGMMAFCTLFFFVSEKNLLLEGRNLMDAIIASTLEVSSSRGLGYTLFEGIKLNSEVALLIANVFGAGPFSTGGGLTLLFFPALVYLTFSQKKSSNENLKLSYMLVKNILVYSITAFTIITMVKFMLSDNSWGFDLLYRQWLIFSQHSIASPEVGTGFINTLVDMVTVLSGRFSFVAACFLTLKQNRK